MADEIRREAATGADFGYYPGAPSRLTSRPDHAHYGTLVASVEKAVGAIMDSAAKWSTFFSATLQKDVAGSVWSRL
ncbi:unnamed protein product, partial [Durusdinium trenchii]